MVTMEICCSGRGLICLGWWGRSSLPQWAQLYQLLLLVGWYGNHGDLLQWSEFDLFGLVRKVQPSTVGTVIPALTSGRLIWQPWRFAGSGRGLICLGRWWRSSLPQWAQLYLLLLLVGWYCNHRDLFVCFLFIHPSVISFHFHYTVETR